MAADNDRAERIVFRLFGPLTIDGVEVRLGSKAAAVLAMLLLAEGAPVPHSQIARGLWGEEQPASGPSLIAAYVSRARRLLSGNASTSPISLASAPGGYRLLRAPRSVDLEHFRLLVSRAQDTLSPRRKSALLDDALALWGKPMEGLSGPWADETRGRLEQERLDAELARAKALINSGDSADAITRLASLAAEAPLHESTRELLVQALAESGRKAEALAAYGAFSRFLADELGIEPGPRLQVMRDRLLHGSPVPDQPNSISSGQATNVVQAGAIHGSVHVHTRRSRPMMAPPAPAPFVNRDREREKLLALLATEPSGVILLHGPPGIGKTSLALRVAEDARKREWFPGGELFATVRGNAPEQVVAKILRALGVPADEIPSAPDRLAALYRRQITHRTDQRMLLILDDVDNQTQLRPLLPAADTCAVLVTSRASANQLGATRSIELHPFAPATVAHFLRAQPSGSELGPDETTEIARLSGGLPLALRIIAERMSYREPRQVIQELTSSGPDVTAVGKIFAAAIDHLDLSDDHFLRRLALNPTGDVSFEVAVVLGDGAEADISAQLELLHRSSLVDWRPEAGRIGMHSLVRASARQGLLAAEDRYPAIERMLRYYLRLARQADLALDPGQAEGELPPADASTWLADEVSNLHGAVTLAANEGFPVIARDLARALYWFHASRGTWVDLAAVTRVALAAAVTAGDRAGEAMCLSTIADCHTGLDELEESAVIYRQALAINQELGDVRAQGSMLSNLGGVQLRTEDFAGAGESYRAALDCFRELDDQRGEAIVLINLASTYREMGRGEEAVNLCRRALAVYCELGDRRGEAVALHTLGTTLRTNDQLLAAAQAYRRAVNAYRDIDDDASASNALDALAATLRALGRETDAVAVYDRAFDAYREQPPDRTAISIDHLATYLSTPRGRAGWEHIVTLASRSAVAGPELARTIRDHRNRPMNEKILADLFRLLQDLAERDDDLAVPLADWAVAAEAAEISGRVPSTHNVISGSVVSGKVVQARDLFGSITFEGQS